MCMYSMSECFRSELNSEPLRWNLMLPYQFRLGSHVSLEICNRFVALSSVAQFCVNERKKRER